MISLRRITDGYTTLSEVYRYIIDDAQIDQDIRDAEGDSSTSRPTRHRDRRDDYHDARCAARRGRTGTRSAPTHMAHPYDAELEAYLAGRRHPVRGAQAGSDAVCADRRHRLEAIERWYHNGPGRSSTRRSRSSIVEGIVVFLSLFDDNPAVHRAFCPPRSAYADTAEAGRTAAAAAARGTARDRAGARPELSRRR